MALTRLKKRSEFLQVAASKVFAKSQTVIVQCLPVKKEDGAVEIRVGFTASKRVGNAVCRNRAKRRLRAWVDQYLKKKMSNVAVSYDFVFIALPSTGNAEFSKLSFDLEQSVERCLRQVPFGF
jgi:ribonuclease P protein component